jgi:hypothetical protein
LPYLGDTDIALPPIPLHEAVEVINTPEGLANVGVGFAIAGWAGAAKAIVIPAYARYFAQELGLPPEYGDAISSAISLSATDYSALLQDPSFVEILSAALNAISAPEGAIDGTRRISSR